MEDLLLMSKIDEDDTYQGISLMDKGWPKIISF